MKVILFANSDWYLFNFRLALAKHLRDSGADVHLLSPPGRYSEALLGLGFNWEPVPLLRKSLNPFRELLLLFDLARKIRRARPDLIHSFTIKCAVYGSFVTRVLFPRAARVNAVAGLGSVYSRSGPLARLLRGVLSILFPLALGGKKARLIVQNVTDGDRLVAIGASHTKRVRLIPSSGVDCWRFRPRVSPRTAQPLSVLLASRMLRQKGIYEFVEAAREIKKSGRVMRFLLAGDVDPGNPDSISKDQLLSWHHSGVVTWLGHVDAMSDLMRECDVFVLPSYYGEGLPRSIIEASASGLAIVTTDMPGCRDAVDDHVTGLIIPAKSPLAIVEALHQLDTNREFLEHCGREARKKALAEFSESSVIAQTVAVYKEVLNP